MSHNPKTARLSIASYRAMFTPRAPQAEREIVIISDDEEMATPTPTPAPTPVAVPVYPVVATPEESTATSPTPAPSPTAPVEDEEIGWKCKYYFKPALETAYYHSPHPCAGRLLPRLARLHQLPLRRVPASIGGYLLEGRAGGHRLERYQ